MWGRRKDIIFTFNVDYSEYEYPGDCFELYEYLLKVGDLHTDPYCIPSYYREFSEEVYSSAWVCLNDRIKLEFARWLAAYHLK